MATPKASVVQYLRSTNKQLNPCHTYMTALDGGTDKSHQPFGLRWFSGKSSSLNPLGKGLPLPLPLPQGFNRAFREALELLVAASLPVLVDSFFALLSNLVCH